MLVNTLAIFMPSEPNFLSRELSPLYLLHISNITEFEILT